MDYKYIGGRKFKKTGSTQLQNQEIERRSILSIRSNSQALNSLFNQISMYSPSMVSPTASPIKPNTNSNTTFNYTPLKQFMQAPSFAKQHIKQQQHNPEVKTLKKKSISSVHFTTYMKPIGNISSKLKGLLQKQKECRQLQVEKELNKISTIKKKTKEEYKSVMPKYQSYKQAKTNRQQAVAQRMVEKQEQQMSGVTFIPKINHNIEIKQPFQTRLQQHQIKKQQRTCQTIQQIMKKQTFKPKINQSFDVQSKVKQIWKKSPQKNPSLALSNSFRSDFKQLSLGHRGEYKVVDSTDLCFINRK